ncbi:MAG: PstA family ABC transporter permease, partial [Pseudomonadota bacterium]
MTEAAITHTGILDNKTAAERRAAGIRKRFAAERRFKYIGLGAVLLAGFFLVLLLSTVVGKGIPAFTYYYAKVPVNLTEVSAEDPGAANYNTIIRNAVGEVFPSMTSRQDSRIARSILSTGSGLELREEVIDDPSLIGEQTQVGVPVSDFADLYLKGLTARYTIASPQSALNLQIEEDKVTGTADSPVFSDFLALTKETIGEQAEVVAKRISAEERGLARQTQIAGGSGNEKAVEDAQKAIPTIKTRLEDLRAQFDALIQREAAAGAAEVIDTNLPSLLIYANGGTIKVTEIAPDSFVGTMLLPFETDAPLTAGSWQAKTIPSPESDRKFSDMEVALIDKMQSQDLVERRINSIFLTTGASREPELAGIWGAVLGSFYTMVVTLLLSFPIGVAAAIYLEEFAPKNRLTDFIEVNINNLAAVPSIVFGLLGLAVFLNWFSMPRSAPLVGGMVLALMTLPTIIIASRAALKAVPPSIRQAALGVGASRIQAVFHHVLPLAIPGMLTGTIIGMAQALGET